MLLSITPNGQEANGEDRGPMTTNSHDTLSQTLSRFQQPGRFRSIWQLVNTLIPYAALWVLADWALDYSFWLALPIMVLMSGFVIRTFIIFHDCGHRSFFKSRKATTFWGYVTGILTLTPFHYWHSNHAKHHATSGNLDKRGFGDVWMMTLEEYNNASKRTRLQYRLYRHPLIMFLLGPLFISLITHRVVRRKAKRLDKISVWVTNVGILAVAVGLSFLFGWKDFLIIQSISVFVGMVGGVWLFYVQHQFEGVYWERGGAWDFVEASLEGSSFYDLPAVLRWFTGNIGYHHVHHLNPRIPNYYLPRTHEEAPVLQKAPTVGPLSSLKALRFRLWDENTGRMISFREAKRARAASKAA